MTSPQYQNLFKDLDRETFEDYVNELDDLAPTIERVVSELRIRPDERDHLSTLFRAFHNLKGDAALCRFEYGQTLAHHVESILMRVREGELYFSTLLADAILLALDRLELVVEAIIQDKSFTHLHLQRLVDGLDAISHGRADRIDGLSAQLIEGVTGFKAPAAAAHDAAERLSSGGDGAVERSADLEFFQSLALQLESRSELFLGRTARILRLARELNEAAGKAVDPMQLEAAIYLHDLGMMFLPESVWMKSGRLETADRQQLRDHPAMAAGLIERMKPWQGAAEMIAQHHEKPDGTGYPKGLAGDAICAGAKILAIVDAFESVMLKHRHRGQNLSLLRAAAEINACVDQFASEWLEPFNKVVRKLLAET